MCACVCVRACERARKCAHMVCVRARVPRTGFQGQGSRTPLIRPAKHTAVYAANMLSWEKPLMKTLLVSSVVAAAIRSSAAVM